MIHTITRREYAVGCDSCGKKGPAAASSDDACESVRALGWEARTPIPRFTFLTTWICSACQQRRETAQSA